MNSVKIPAEGKSYHHGDLRRQLITATEEIIGERGVDGFTLREAARRAGVSPAAPAHHFADAKGLLTEVALLGFRDFGAALSAADARGGADPARRLAEQASAYVGFALAHPARFQLMFRADKHDHGNAEFVREAGQAYRVLEGAIRAATRAPADGALTADQQGMLTAVWSMVHGFAHLVIGGEFADPGRGGGGADHVLRRLLPEAVSYILSPLAQRQ